LKASILARNRVHGERVAIGISGAGTTQPEELKVENRFLSLREPAKLRDRIDGWRVCWLGGWDKSKVLYKVMVERVVRSFPSL
jgi:hypothetical protein